VTQRGREAEPLGDRIPQRDVTKAQVCRHVQHAGELVHYTRHHDTAGDRDQALRMGRRRELLGRTKNGRQHRIGAVIAPGRAAQHVSEIAGLIDEGAFDAGSPDIDSNRYTAHLRT
jgi:hypothetical protein